jgi:hypothetical protein
MTELPPLVVRALASMQLDDSMRATMDTLLCWAFELEGTLAVTGLSRVGAVLEAIDLQPLLPGETEADRGTIKAKIVARLLE